MKTNMLFSILLLVGLTSLSCKKEVLNLEQKKNDIKPPNYQPIYTENRLQNWVIKDIDGNSYQSKKIGKQTWMTENLKVSRYRDGYPIHHSSNPATWASTSVGSYCWYNSNIRNKSDYGALYNWHAVNSSRQLAPEGWHIPSQEEWKQLAEYLNGTDFAGGQLKEIGNTHWIHPNTAASDGHGFKALPGGGIGPDGAFHQMNSEAFFWTSTYTNVSQNASYVHMGYNHAELLFSGCGRSYGFAVRCIKD